MVLMCLFVIVNSNLRAIFILVLLTILSCLLLVSFSHFFYRYQCLCISCMSIIVGKNSISKYQPCTQVLGSSIVNMKLLDQIFNVYKQDNIFQCTFSCSILVKNILVLDCFHSIENDINDIIPFAQLFQYLHISFLFLGTFILNEHPKFQSLSK